MALQPVDESKSVTEALAFYEPTGGRSRGGESDAILTSGGCASPVANPDTAQDNAWNDVLRIKASRNLNSSISFVQDIATTGAGDVNLDMYSITIDADGKNAQQTMSDFRKNIDKYIYSGTQYSVYPFDARSEELWNSDSPRGAVMVFKLAAIAGFPLERGAVVLSCFSSTSFVFSTVNIDGLASPGDHPVSGNRAFGVAENPDGSLTIFTKAADRRKGDNPIYEAMGSEEIFGKGAQVWIGLMENLKTAYAAFHPRQIVTYRRVVAWAGKSSGFSSGGSSGGGGASGNW